MEDELMKLIQERASNDPNAEGYRIWLEYMKIWKVEDPIKAAAIAMVMLDRSRHQIAYRLNSDQN